MAKAAAVLFVLLGRSSSAIASTGSDGGGGGGARVKEEACPLHCSLNGRCDSSTGVCACAPGWVGSNCRSLALLPLAPPSQQAYCHFNDSTWGGSVIRGDDGVYHLFFSEMSNNCSLHDYGSVSRVAHATADRPQGPFVRRGIALPVFAHNPQIVRDPTDGTYLLYHIGDTVPESCVPDCRGANAAAGGEAPSSAGGAPAGGGAAAACPKKGHGTSVATSASPWGPWTQHPYVLPEYTNPSPLIFPNGTVLLAARADGIHILRADHWNASYTHVTHVVGHPYEDPFRE
jgi:hypothetical protein